MPRKTFTDTKSEVKKAFSKAGKVPKDSATIPRTAKGTPDVYRGDDNQGVTKPNAKKIKPRKIVLDEDLVFNPCASLFHLMVRLARLSKQKYCYHSFNECLVLAGDDDMGKRPRADGAYGLTFQISGRAYHIHEESEETTFQYMNERLDEVLAEIRNEQEKADAKAAALDRAREVLTPDQLAALGLR
jgi:hypothetical protein